MRAMTEAEFQDNVIDFARTLGWMVHHCRPARLRNDEWVTPIQGDPGFPDLVLVRAGRVVFAELKSETGKLTPTQERWMSGLSGNDVHLWRPDDLECIGEVLTPKQRIEK